MGARGVVTYTALRVLGLPVESWLSLGGGGGSDVMVSRGWWCMRDGCGSGVGVGM